MHDDALDLVIIGAAAAGCAAAVYAARRNLNFVVISKDIGGEVALSGEVENWPGTIHTTGYELSQDFYKHTQAYNVKVNNGEEVTGMKQDGKFHIISTKTNAGEEKTYTTKSIIIATGIHPRHLGIPGESELKGRGVTYCTVCDGPLFRDKTTATIGAGSSALESALMMSGIAKKVYLITKYPNTPEKNGGFPPGEHILIEKVKEKDNIEILYTAMTTKIEGDGKVETLTYNDQLSGDEKTISVDGVMVHIGMNPNSKFVECSSKNKQGEIEVDILCKTDCAGVFAAGDVTNVPYNQIASAAGQGVTAALSSIDYLNKWSA